jgi:hypothetical protein
MKDTRIREVFPLHKNSQMRKEGFEMKTMSTVLFALLLASFGPAQQRWTKTYGGADEDEGRSVRQTLDGGYIVAGKTASYGAGYDDFYLIKTDSSGDTIWTRTFGGAVRDWAWSVLQTPDSGYIVAGQTSSSGAGDKDYYLVKTDAAGSFVWGNTIGGAGLDEGRSVQLTTDSIYLAYIVGGYTTSSGTGSYDFFLVKTTAGGDTIWTGTYGGTNEDVSCSVLRTLDSGYAMVGYTASFGSGDQDVYLVKTNAGGETTWTRRYGGPGNEIGYSVQQTPDSGYIIAGHTDAHGGDVYLIKTNASGDTLWTRTYGGPNDDQGNSVRQTSDGGYIIAGQTMPYSGSPYDVSLIKTNASGDTLWTRTWGGSGVDFANSVEQTSDGGYIIAGYTAPSAGAGDVWLIKTDANGSVSVEEPGSSRQGAAGSIKARPNPFTSFARIPGHETEQFSLYDISGELVGTCSGNRVGEGLAPAVYFIKPGDGPGMSLRVVKVR